MLKKHLFETLREARQIDAWKIDYNARGTHSLAGADPERVCHWVQMTNPNRGAALFMSEIIGGRSASLPLDTFVASLRSYS
jgi:hypothetical protein